MKFIISVLIFSRIVTANSDVAASMAATAALTGGAVYAINSIQYDNWLKAELEDWKDNNTGMTTVLTNKCDVNIEARILGTRRENAIFFSIGNNTKKNITIKPYKITAEYSSGRLRRFKSNIATKDINIDKDWVVSGIFHLEDKTEFKGIEWIDLTIPVLIGEKNEACNLKAKLKRNLKLEQSRDSFTRYLTLDLAFKFGPNISAGGDSEKFYQSQNNFSIDFNMYFWKTHGIHVGINRGDVKNRNTDQFEQEINASDNVDLSESFTMIGYAGHRQLSKKYTLFWNAGFGSYMLENLNFDNDKREFLDESILTPYATLELDYAFFRRETGYWMGDWFIGGALFYRQIPSYDIGEVEMGGDVLSLLFSFRMAL